jgi:hypothetical protein
LLPVAPLGVNLHQEFARFDHNDMVIGCPGGFSPISARVSKRQHFGNQRKNEMRTTLLQVKRVRWVVIAVSEAVGFFADILHWLISAA